MNQDKLKFPIEIISGDASTVLNDINNQEVEGTSQESAFSLIIKRLKTFFSSIGKPTFKPSYINKGAPPYSVLHNENVIQLINDFNRIKAHQSSMSNVLLDAYNYSVSQREKLNNKLKEANNLIDDLRLYTKSPLAVAQIFGDTFSDKTKILELSNLDIDTTSGVITLKKESSENLVTTQAVIQVLEQSNGFGGNYPEAYIEAVQNQPLIEPLETEDIKSSAEEVSDAVKFYGDPDLHNDLTTILDGKPDTWYEYQKVTVYEGTPPKIGKRNSSPANLKEGLPSNPNTTNRASMLPYELTANLGWDLVGTDGKPIRIVGDPKTGILNCLLMIDLGEVKNVNWISLTPWSPAVKGYFYSVADVLISTDGARFEPALKNMSKTIAEAMKEDETTVKTTLSTLGQDNSKFSGIGAWNIPPTPMRAVLFKLKQDKFYGTNVGHIYYELTGSVTKETKTKSLFKKRTSSDTIELGPFRVPGPDYSFEVANGDTIKMVSKSVSEDKLVVGGIGSSKSSPLTLGNIVGRGVGGFVVGALASMNPLVGAAIGAITALFGKKTTVSLKDLQSETKSGKELFPAIRWNIGIRDIGLWKFKFGKEGYFISAVFNTAKNIRKVSLITDESIADELLTESNIGDIIKYFVSFDGTEWHRICPQNHGNITEAGKQIPVIINLGTNIAADSQRTNQLYLDITDQKQIQLKCQLTRTIESTEFTPVVNGYKIKIITEE